jgi:3-oxoacyl-[acyl-carrier-protein] synthase II
VSRRVVITGMGAVSPLGVGAETLFARWAAGECGIEDGAGLCDEFEPTEFLTAKQARRADRFVQLAVAASDEALAQAGWSEEKPYEPASIGCVIGTGIGGLASLEKQHDVLRDRGAKVVSPLSVPLMMGNAAAAAVAMRHRLQGQSYGVVSACAAGAHAIGSAMRMIHAGDAEAVVTGGAEAAVTALAEAAFAAMDATSKSGISRPFDRRRDGFVMGEGAGVLVLEDADAAARRGAEPLAELLGYGATSDAHHITAPEPEGQGAARAIELAMADASVSPEQVDYVNAHGTSTPLNDRAETEAIKSALGDAAMSVPVSSTKSTIGHLLGAAGAVEAIATVFALRERTAPPTLGYEQPDEGLDLDYVPDGAKPLGNGNGAPDRVVAISNAFGFGGHNAVLCLGSAGE